MPILPVAPTKSNLLAVKSQLAVARDGYELLEQKREILVLELMERLAEVKQLERDVARRLESAYPALRRTLVSVGRRDAQALGNGVPLRAAWPERRLVVAGLSFSVLEPRFEESAELSVTQTPAVCDPTVIELGELVVLLGRLASLRAVVVRLAVEVKKTQRRVNALEKLVIPQTRETVQYITNVLEEQERDAFFVRKRLKARR